MFQKLLFIIFLILNSHIRCLVNTCKYPYFLVSLFIQLSGSQNIKNNNEEGYEGNKGTQTIQLIIGTNPLIKFINILNNFYN